MSRPPEDRIVPGTGTLADQRKAELRRRIEHNFKYYPPKGEDDVDAYKRIREAGKTFALELVRLVPYCRELHQALTDVEDAVMHANAGRARGGKNDGA